MNITKMRYRVGSFGKLILQVYESWTEDGRDFGCWRDAKVEDLDIPHLQQRHQRHDLNLGTPADTAESEQDKYYRSGGIHPCYD